MQGPTGTVDRRAARKARGSNAAPPIDAYFRGPVSSAEVALLLGGETAGPAGECAPDASSGLLAAAVTGAT
jgi:hypothetical protein